MGRTHAQNPTCCYAEAVKTIVSVCSARPNFVKVAAVHHALQESGHGAFNHVIVHTGQHYDPLLSDVFFKQLKIPDPAFNLGVHGGNRDEVLSNTQAEFAKVLPEIKPDIVLVYGDVNGALGAARAAKAAGYRVGHVEAGLRSFDETMPEEHNRIEVDTLADFLFVSEESGMGNLQKEGVKGDRFLVGNVMIDTLVRLEPEIEKAKKIMRDRMPITGTGSEFAIATIHRPSNVDDPTVLKGVIEFLQEVSQECIICLPPHPRLRNALKEMNYISDPNKRLVIMDEPLPYIDFIAFVSCASFIITDSGGIQEEATFLGRRCFTLRRNTERPSTIQSGSNMLIDPSIESDRRAVIEFAKNLQIKRITVPELWDGKAGERIVQLLMQKL